MSASATALALASAVLHAAWNLLLGRARDVEAATAATFVLSFLLAAPFAAVWWHADASVWPYALASTLLEVVYVGGLALGYQWGDVSFVYPVTRGLAPVLALVAGVVLLGHGASVGEVIGIVLVGGGILLVRGAGRAGDLRGPVVTVVTAASIAGYTLVDHGGVQRAGALAYFLLIMVGPTLVYPFVAGPRAMVAAIDRNVVLAAATTFGSFVLGLLALRHGSAAAVLAVRSSSIVVTALLAGRVLQERVTPVRLVGSAVVFAGVVLVAR